MFINPSVGGRLATDHHRDLLASAQRQRLIRQLRTAGVASCRTAGPGRRVRAWAIPAVARRRSATAA
jgi:hypothetical protein